MGNHWTLQDAETKFSAVVEAARNGEPQHVTTGGLEAVVVLAAAEYERLTGYDQKPKKTFVEHLMDFPKIPEEFEDIFEKRQPMKLEHRDVDFD